MSHNLSVAPARAVDGGRVTVRGTFSIDRPPQVTFGTTRALIEFLSPNRLITQVPADLDGGLTSVHVNGESAAIAIGIPWATGLHQVDNPAFDRDGNLYVTYSGARGQAAPVSIFRVTPAGTREPFASGIVNPTSMTFGPDGLLYVSSRFEGSIYRIGADGAHKIVASDLGVACGIAFDPDGWMYVGDRSGTVFRIRDGKAVAYATLPASVAAFHLAMSPTGHLYVAAPTLDSCDRVYEIAPGGATSQLPFPFGRPQGLAFGPDGALHVVEALAGASGVYRLTAGRDDPELVVSGVGLVGVAFGPDGSLVVASNETAYRFDAA